MAKCSYCGSTIVLGGRKQGELRFCNAKCEQNGIFLTLADQLPADLVAKQVQAIHAGLCPKCGGNGPVDVHTSHRIWSAVLLTSWQSRPQICCHSCGTKAKITDTIFSLFLGWWGIPHGLLITPVQIGRNIYGIFQNPDPLHPSEQLEKMVKIFLAKQIIEEQQKNAPPPPT